MDRWRRENEGEDEKEKVTNTQREREREKAIEKMCERRKARGASNWTASK